MAKASSLPICFFLILLSSIVFSDALNDVLFQQAPSSSISHPTGGEGSVPLQDCPKACGVRCSATSHKKPCMFYCNYCCERCLCVPSGTYGNREECPCYNNIKTQEGANKCP